MIDFVFIFQYKQTIPSLQTIGQYQPLSSVKMTKVNLNTIDGLSYQDPQNITQFIHLSDDLTKQKLLFKKMIQEIVKSIGDFMINFVNVILVCQDTNFFTQIIPKQCQKRQLSMPFVLMNFLDIRELVRNQYQCPYKKLTQISQYLKTHTIKQAQNKSQTQLIQKILRKTASDKKLQNTSEKFIKKYEKIIQNQYVGKYKYYKIIGLPFKSIPSQILQILAPQVLHDRKDICFIYDKQLFSGRGIIKVPQDYEKYLIMKNRMYIGKRYIELEASTEQQFQKAKIKLQHQKQQKSPHRQKRRQHHKQSQKNLYNIGGRRRSRSSSSEHRRSREKYAGFKNENRSRRDQYQSNKFDTGLNMNSGQYGIKVRGLPFAFSEWDVENIFNYYNILGGSVKLGIKPGTHFKNGQAVILMRSYNDAQKALDMNGYNCMGRYLQVKVIKKQQYEKYK